MGDSTPVDFLKDLCKLDGYMATSWNNKVYVFGGNQIIKPKTYLWQQAFANRHLRILDFTSSVDIATQPIVSIEEIPIDVVPPMKCGSVFTEDGKIHAFGGGQEPNTVLMDDGSGPPDNTVRPSIPNKIFTYDIQTKLWSTRNHTISKTLNSANLAYDPTRKIGWLYGGFQWEQDYKVNRTTVKTTLTPSTFSDFMRYNLSASSISTVTAPVNPVGLVTAGGMTFLPTVGKEGALVLFGGRIDNENMRDIMKIYVFDISTNTWFTQDATSEGGNGPTPRYRFCTVNVSAADKSSHHIFVYGGALSSNAPASLSDVYVLTLPAFHWIRIGNAPLGKSSHMCVKLQNKYMMSYRGMEDRTSNMMNDCDQQNGGIQIFDMEALNWTTRYEVRAASKRAVEPEYKIPQGIYNIIGGDAYGNATFLEPRNGWADPKLAAMFATENTNKTTNTTRTVPTPTSSPTTTSKPSSLVPILVGVLGGLVVVALILGLISLYLVKRKRQEKEKNEQALATELEERSGASLLTPYNELNGAPYDQRYHSPARSELPGTMGQEPVELGPGAGGIQKADLLAK